MMNLNIETHQLLHPLQGIVGEPFESVISLCLKTDPNERPSCDRLDRYLTDFADVVRRSSNSMQ